MPPNEVAQAYIAIRASTAGFASQAKEEVNAELRGARESAVVPVRATINRSSEGELKQSMGSMVKNVAGYVGGIFAAEKVFDFAKDVVNEAAAIQKAEESIRSEYGQTAEAVTNFAHTTATQYGISAAASETASAKVGALLQNMGFAPAKAAQMDLGLQKVVGSMSEMRNIDPSSVLDRLNTTLATGSTRGLRDLGVALDSASIKAEALKEHLPGIVGPSNAVAAAQLKVTAAQQAYNDALAHHSKNSEVVKAADVALTTAHQNLAQATRSISGTLTVAEKDQAIYGLVTAHSGELQREAAKHSGDLAVQQKILSAEWANAKAALGETLLPVITSLFRELVTGVSVVREYRTEFISAAAVIGTASAAWLAYRVATKTAQGVSELATGAMKVLRREIVFQTAAVTEQQAVMAGATAGQEAYAAAIAAGATEQEAATAATEAATAAQEGLDAALLANPIGLTIAAIALLAGGLYELYEHSSTARHIMQEVWHEMGHLEGAAADLVGGALGDLPGIIGDVSGALRSAGGAVASGTRSLVGGVEEGIQDVETVWNDFWGSGLGDEVRFGVRIVKAEVMAVVRVVEDVVNLVGDVIHGRWGAIWHDLGDLVRDGIRLVIIEMFAMDVIVLHAAIQIGEAIWHGIRGQVTKLPGEVWNVIREIPGAELRGLGVIGGAAERLGAAALHALIGEAEKLPGQVWSVITEIPRVELRGVGIIVSAAEHLGHRLVTAAISEARHLPGQVRDVIHDLGPMISGVIPWIINQGERLGSRLLHGAIEGVKHLGGDLKNSIEDGVKGALSDLNPFSPVEHGAKRYIADPIISGTRDGLGGFGDILQAEVVTPMRRVLLQADDQGTTLGHQFGVDMRVSTMRGLNPLQDQMRILWRTILHDVVTNWTDISSTLGGWVRRAVSPVNQVLTGIGGNAIHVAAPKAAKGGIFRDVPGGLLHVVEGGHPESIVPHDPQYRARAIEIIHETLKAFGLPGVVPMAAGGITDAGLTSGDARLADMIRGWGGIITSTTGGQHAQDSYHYRGEAIDTAYPQGNPGNVWGNLFGHRNLWVELFGPTALPGGGLYHYGSRFTDPGLQAEHQNHIHVAFTGTVAQLLAGLRGAAIQGIGGGGGLAMPFGGDPVGYLRGHLPDLPGAGPASSIARQVAAYTQQVILHHVADVFQHSGVSGTAASGGAQQIGRAMMIAAGWPASQWGALQALWTRESGWNPMARNPSSGAFGIPQELGHSVNAAYLAGDVRAQIAWGLEYIRARYGSPAAAWQHETSVGWYGGGGQVPGPQGAPQAAVVHGGEVIFTPDQMRALTKGGGVNIEQLVIVEPQGGRQAADAFLNEVANRAR